MAIIIYNSIHRPKVGIEAVHSNHFFWPNLEESKAAISKLSPYAYVNV